MDGPASIVDDLNEHVDIMGQQPGLQIYTQICLCFSVTDAASSHSAIISTLTSGLERLSASFPWIAGQVVNEDSSEGNSGIFKIKPLLNIPRLVVKDLRNEFSAPTMEALRQASFPISMLDEDIVAPRKTLPSDAERADSAPVFLLQANFVTGGLVLTILGHHMAMDMTGQGQMMHLLSKACRNEPFTSEELSSGNVPRHNMIPLLEEDYDTEKSRSELADSIKQPTPPQSADNPPPPPPPKATWSSFIFSPTSLTALKSLANQSITTSYISTDDALTAFIWQSVIRARVSRLFPTNPCTLTRAIDARPYLSVSNTYPGLLQNLTYHKSTVQALATAPLGSIASQLRAALAPSTSTITHDIRALATLLSRSPDKGSVSFAASLDLSVDVMVSSWAKVDAYALDFGLGCGKPEAVRRPRLDSVESLVYLLPKPADGEIAVAICLRDEDLVRLRADEVFGEFARHVG